MLTDKGLVLKLAVIRKGNIIKEAKVIFQMIFELLCQEFLQKPTGKSPTIQYVILSLFTSLPVLITIEQIFYSSMNTLQTQSLNL